MDNARKTVVTKLLRSLSRVFGLSGEEFDRALKEAEAATPEERADKLRRATLALTQPLAEGNRSLPLFTVSDGRQTWRIRAPHIGAALDSWQLQHFHKKATSIIMVRE